ncbi:MAG: hypothetical protein PHS62_04985 [Patescibacteria group bacterium]|nr:hypothetical protein [Patescibacteria group bacterium]
MGLNKKKQNQAQNNALPDFFRPILWSFDFNEINPDEHKKTIILNAINYGDLKHWRWLAEYYGRETIREILSNVSATELRPRALNLARLIFSIKNFNYAPRGAK